MVCIKKLNGDGYNRDHKFLMSR